MSTIWFAIEVFIRFAAVFCASPALTVLAQNPPAASPPGPSLDAFLQKPAARQLLASMGPGVSMDAKVARLIDRLVLDDRAAVQAAVTALVMVGEPAVPAIVRRLDDRRPMKQ